jgi:hypothetical protein
MDTRFLIGSCLLLCACAGASAQDTRPAEPDAPRAPRLRMVHPDGQVLQLAPRLRGEGPRLGVTVDSTPDGLKVTAVDEVSLAASAGVQPEDVLLRIGSQRIESVEDVAVALAHGEPGQEYEVTVIRPGQGLLTLQGKLPPPPEGGDKAPGADGLRGGFLGVQMKGDDERGDCGGVAVAGVVPESAAWFAGLEEGDCLLTLDGKELAGSEDLAGAVAGKEPGTLVELCYRRDGAEQVARVRLGHRSPLGMLGGEAAPGAFLQMPGMLRFRGPQGDQQFFLGEPGQPNPHGLQWDGAPGEFQLFHSFDGLDNLDDLHGMLKDLHLRQPDGQGGHSVEVRIDDGHMTVTRDGATEHFTRDADGNWIKDDAAPEPQQDT